MIYFYIEIPKVFRNIAQVYRQFQHVYKMTEVKAIERIKQNAEDAKNTINTLKNEVSYYVFLRQMYLPVLSLIVGK